MVDEVRVTRGADLATSGGQTDGMQRLGAFSDVSDQLNSNLMIAEPKSGSAVHHHGNEDTIVYAVKGRGSIVYGRDGSDRHDLAPGDWALIPAFTPHQEVNDSDDKVVWVIVRGGRAPVVENLPGWPER